MQAARLKLTVSVIIIIIGLSATVIALSSTSETVKSGIIIDFGDRETVYTAVDSESYPDPLSALQICCDANDFELVVEDGRPTSIGGICNDRDSEWILFVVEPGDIVWKSMVGDASNITINDYSAVCWGYSTSGSEPTRAVDETGVCFYGYEKPTRVVSMAPSCTESLCAAGGAGVIIATDAYSNYPASIREGHESGTISVIGGFTNPSYEMILKAKPDLVVCIGSQSSHIATAEKLRTNNINVIVTSGGEAIETVMDNTFMLGVALHERDIAESSIDTAMNQISQVEDILDNDIVVWDKRVMVSLSAVKSPWVAGSDTYVADVLTHICTTNIYDSEYGWVQVNSETILKKNPEYIIIVSSDYSNTQEDYDRMMDSLGVEWRGTDAVKSGNVYLFTDEACDVMSRPGPRVAQITELLARAVQGDAFDDGIELPKYVGDDYRDYLNYTKEGSI